ncbi:2-phosphosulfolactate phosphatase [Chromobacterium sp. CV08]|uniref:2-phosphosulfolactate phosphatase n=1 Tax=Chromobacterium sp. CV08 TaxID=3133274 RepID=UPI003DA9197B
MHYAQQEFSVRLQWGLDAARLLSGQADHCVVVDVLSFSTSVDVACARGAEVWPYHERGDDAQAFAEARRAQLAARRNRLQPSLSPASLQQLADGSRLVLPSPNGARTSLASCAAGTVAGCLRNAAAVAAHLEREGGSVLVIAAGEVDKDGRLRFAYEDFIGAGAIIYGLSGSKTPEALAAEAAFVLARHDLENQLGLGASAAALRERGFEEDVALAAQLNVSDCVPLLRDGAYRALEALAGA